MAHLGPNVPGGVLVAMSLVAACLADEFRLVFPVGLLAKLTLVTRPAGIPGIDIHHVFPDKPGLLLEEPTELRERPTTEPIPCLSNSSRDQKTDVFQVFQGDSPPSAFGGSYGRFQDDVILERTTHRCSSLPPR
jgi:hypothetical protein